MKKKYLLNEIMGVPKALYPWIKSFTKIVMDKVNDVVDNSLWDEEGIVVYEVDGEEVSDTAYRTNEIEISGKKVQEELIKINGFSNEKEFVNSDMFSGLPIWRPDIYLNIAGVPEHVLKHSPKAHEDAGELEARVGSPANVKLKKLGDHTILSEIHFIFEIVINKDGLDGAKEEKMISKVVSHELLHVYQMVKQLESGISSHFGPETILNVLPQHPDTSQTGLGYWDYFLNLVYLHLSFEINARVNELYYLLKDTVKTKEEFLKKLKNSEMWRQVDSLEKFDAKEYIKKFKYPKVNFESPLEMLSTLQTSVELAKRGVDIGSKDKVLTSLIKLWDKTIQVGVQELDKMGVNIPMEKVPKKAKENPYEFFKFFEKRFHKKAKTWKRKLYRLASLLLSEKDPLSEGIIKEERVVNFDSPKNNFVVIAGGPGVGKSFITNNLINLNNIKYFNVDQVRVAIAKKLWGDEWEKNISTPDGYQKILDLTHTTSDPRNLTVKFLKNFLQIERKEGINIIYDAGGGQREVMEDVWKLAKDNGYHTTLVYVRTPLEVAQERNIKRPRKLQPDMVSSYHQQVKDNIRYLIDKFDSVWFVDNKDTIDMSDRPTENIEQIK